MSLSDPWAPSMQRRLPLSDRVDPRTGPPHSDPRPSTTAQHVGRLFTSWTRHVSRKLELKLPRRHRGVPPESYRSDPILDLSQLVPIQQSVIATQSQTRESPTVGNAIERETLDHRPPLSHEAFLEIVEQGREAIAQDVHPRLNSKGSSGSYFVRDASDSTTLGVFKPADEAPYGAMNPKVVKRVHRSLHRVAPRLVPFGRGCLVPGQSYLSESAASVLDRHLESFIVPRTEVVGLKSRAFYFDSIERQRAKKDPSADVKEKDGSFQVFLNGFTDASDFFAQHPYPPRSRPTDSANHQSCCNISTCVPCCGRVSADSCSGDTNPPTGTSTEASFEWNPATVASFQLELEKLVLLDYLMRNTDRSLANFMIKPCQLAPRASAAPLTESGASTSRSTMTTTTADPVTMTEREERATHLHLAAIDNSLAFPHTHPRGWRQYPFGWLDLPLALVEQAWSDATRSTYLAKLESVEWWARLGLDLRQALVVGRTGPGASLRTDCGADDDDEEDVWRKQWAVVKGQGWNVVQSLREPGEGPLELCRRRKVLVWDDHVLVQSRSLPDDRANDEIVDEEDGIEQERAYGREDNEPVPGTSDRAAPVLAQVSVPCSRHARPSPPRLPVRRALSDRATATRDEPADSIKSDENHATASSSSRGLFDALTSSSTEKPSSEYSAARKVAGDAEAMGLLEERREAAWGAPGASMPESKRRRVRRTKSDEEHRYWTMKGVGCSRASRETANETKRTKTRTREDKDGQQAADSVRRNPGLTDPRLELEAGKGRWPGQAVRYGSFASVSSTLRRSDVGFLSHGEHSIAYSMNCPLSQGVSHLTCPHP